MLVRPRGEVILWYVFVAYFLAGEVEQSRFLRHAVPLQRRKHLLEWVFVSFLRDLLVLLRIINNSKQALPLCILNLCFEVIEG